MSKTENSFMSIITEEWTTEKLVDEMFLHLIGLTEDVSNNNKERIEVRKYERQARQLIHRIPIYESTPEFTIKKSDLTDKIRKELLENTSIEWCQNVLKRAVGRIFENVNFRYYHLSVAHLLKVRLV